MIREVISLKFIGETLETFIVSQALDLVRESDRIAFLEDVREDLQEIDYSRLAGLGITPQQLDEWLALTRDK